MNLFHLVNGITPDVEVTVRDPDAFYEIAELSGVNNVFWEDIQEMTVEDYNVYCTITDDFGAIAQLPIYEGRAPKYDNEIAVGGVLAQSLGVSVGDEVTVSGNGRSVRYLITGLQQGSTNMGMEIYMTEEGAKHLLIEADREVFCIEVEEPKLENSLRLVEELESMYGTRLLSYENSVETLENGGDITITVCILVISLLLIVSILVIVLSMNLLVKTVIIRKQREYGIEKAIGFSSGQLRLQMALSMMPQTAFGAVFGSLFGYLLSNRLLSVLLYSVGVMKADMEVALWMGLLAAGFVIGMTFLLVWVISSRIRRISAYSLITDA
ncbi:MAG: FtsX-like permease family protein [Lachnospiraceae bacterium]|nr:FtsX-like permease family protein [Lachnospiraceae bacterium]